MLIGRQGAGAFSEPLNRTALAFPVQRGALHTWLAAPDGQKWQVASQAVDFLFEVRLRAKPRSGA